MIIGSNNIRAKNKTKKKSKLACKPALKKTEGGQNWLVNPCTFEANKLPWHNIAMYMFFVLVWPLEVQYCFCFLENIRCENSTKKCLFWIYFHIGLSPVRCWQFLQKKTLFNLEIFFHNHICFNSSVICLDLVSCDTEGFFLPKFQSEAPNWRESYIRINSDFCCYILLCEN